MSDKPTTGALSITGEGYTIALTPEALAAKQKAINEAKGIITVTTEKGAELARSSVKALKSFRTKIEASRKLVKEPILEAGRRVDKVAKDLSDELTAEEKRVEKLVLAFSTEQERQRQLIAAEAERKRKEAEEEARKLQEAEEEARRAKDAALVEEASSGGSTSLADIIARAKAIDEAEAAEKAVEERQAAASAASNLAVALERTASASSSVSVSKIIEFDVLDINEFFKAHPHLVSLAAKTAEVKAFLKAEKARLGKLPSIPGIRVYERERLN